MKLFYFECGDQIGRPPTEGVVQAMQLAGDALRLGTATADQLTRLEVAGDAIGAELARRAFTPRTDERLQASE